MLKGVLADIAQIAIKKTITEPLGNFISSSLSGVDFGSLFGGFKAEGGPVSSGRAYMVGERGPELFVPRSSGNIVPNGGGTAQVSIVNHIDARTDQASVAQMVAAGVQQGMQAYARMQRAQGMA